MATATERITILITAKEKRQIAIMAKDARISMGELLRRAALSYPSSQNDRTLEGMIDQMNKTTVQAGYAIDKAMEFVEASNKRITVMERKSALTQ